MLCTLTDVYSALWLLLSTQCAATVVWLVFCRKASESGCMAQCIGEVKAPVRATEKDLLRAPSNRSPNGLAGGEDQARCRCAVSKGGI